MSTRDVGVVLVAAGSASRYGKPKQFEELGGLPIYLYVARTFSLITPMHTIVIVGRTEDLPEMERGLRDIEMPVKWRLCAGGATRQDSVANGIRTLHEDNDIKIALVHDVARPLVDDVVILSVIDAIRECGSAIAGVEVVDTIKRVVDREIVETVSRENLWRAQTPQGARMELMLAALEAARESNFQGTDESQLLERIGEQPRIVQGSNLNFKITYPIDLERARYAVDNLRSVKPLSRRSES